VPEPGQTVVLRATANLSTGGTAVDRTNEIHPDNAEIARRAAAIVGLDIAGIDFIAPDIAKSVRETGGGIIELNAAPGFRMHLEPSYGPPRDVARPVIDMLFPRSQPSRVPIFAITGTNGKSTVGRMVKQVLRYTGANVGLTSTSGVYVNGVLVASGDATGPKSARIVLRDPSVDIAVLETARGGILREGLAFTDSDVGVVLNVTADHLGLKGIETLDDLANVKSLIVETVHKNGTSVLNADDPLCVRMAKRAGGRLAWFSLNGGPDEMPTFLRRHIEDGGLAVVREPGFEGGTIVYHERGRREVVMEAGAIPGTLHGMATFNIANACATIAMCLAHGVPLLTIRSGMASFQSTFEQNPGRLNVHDEHGFRVILDYAHNAAGLTALGEVVRGLRHRYKRALGVLSIPGDRRDEDIIEMGQIAGGIFDELFFREDPGLRGRSRGEVMELLQRGAVQGGALPEHVHLIPTEAGATAAALLATNPGELLIITPTTVEETWRQIVSFERPEATARPPGLAAAE
jgi:cyanophycin synthetase